MSTALGIAAVTHLLRDLLNEGMINADISAISGSSIDVSVFPPDRITVGSSESSQLNLFLYQVSPNQGWRNECLPSRDASGRHRLTNQPLALDLHYLISAYTSADLHAEILLGHAAQLLHETPVLNREAILRSINPPPDLNAADFPLALRSLVNSGLAEQVEHLKITPEYLSVEELSKLWTAFQSNYRPTIAYQVSVVLIEAQQPARSALPVLSRGPVDLATGRDRGVVVEPSLLPPLPTLDAVEPATSNSYFQIDELVSLTGHHLDGSGRQVNLFNQKFGIEEALAAEVGNQADRVQLIVPAARVADFPVGSYELSVNLVRPGETDPRTSNRLVAQLAPTINGLPINVVRNGVGTASFSINFVPELRDGQTVRLILGQTEYIPDDFVAPTASLNFTITEAPVGDHLARLRIDGVESPLIDKLAEPPEFLNNRVNIS